MTINFRISALSRALFLWLVPAALKAQPAVAEADYPNPQRAFRGDRAAALKDYPVY